MRLRPLLLALLALASGACATPSDPGGQPGATTSSPTAVSRAATAQQGPAEDPPPPGIIAPARRQPAPDLRVTAFDGRIVTLDQFRGRPAVVSFFESWCPICQTEQPDLSKVAKQFAGRVGFVGSPTTTRWPPVAPTPAASRFPIHWPTTPPGRPGLVGGSPTSRSSCWSTAKAGSPSALTAAPPAEPSAPPSPT